MPDLPQTVVLAGVSGSGKSTVAEALAARTGAVLLDADDLHPAGNVAKMAAGVPLSDADREPWIDVVVAELQAHAARGDRVVLACSALRRQHRRRLGEATADVVIVLLDVSDGELQRRLAERADHFMPADLLDSQLDDLERPTSGRTVVVDGDAPVEDVVDEVLRRTAR